jgi:hypothetical protein
MEKKNLESLHLIANFSVNPSYGPILCYREANTFEVPFTTTLNIRDPQAIDSIEAPLLERLHSLTKQPDRRDDGHPTIKLVTFISGRKGGYLASLKGSQS